MRSGRKWDDNSISGLRLTAWGISLLDVCVRVCLSVFILVWSTVCSWRGTLKQNVYILLSLIIISVIVSWCLWASPVSLARRQGILAHPPLSYCGSNTLSLLLSLAAFDWKTPAPPLSAHPPRNHKHGLCTAPFPSGSSVFHREGSCLEDPTCLF